MEVIYLDAQKIIDEPPENGRVRYSSLDYVTTLPTKCPTNGEIGGIKFLGQYKDKKMLCKGFGTIESYFPEPTWIDISWFFRKTIAESTIMLESQELEIVDVVEFVAIDEKLYSCEEKIYWKLIFGAIKNKKERQMETLF